MEVKGEISTQFDSSSPMYLADESGVAYGVKHIGNKPRVSVTPYLYDIAEGQVPGHYGLNKFGHNNDVGATLEAVWDGSGVYTWPTVAATVNAAAGATDGGVVTYTSAATGGTTTTLIDTAQDFTAGSVVAAGDLILDDDNDEIGYVTIVAATILTFAIAKDTAFTLGTNYRIVDKSAGGVGAQVIQVQGLNANYVMQKEFIVLNNATDVPTASTYLRMFRAIVLLSGSAGWNVANITLTGAALIAQITAQENQTLMAVWTVPAGHTFYMTDYYAATSSAKVTEVHLYARPFGGVFNIKSIIVLNQGKSERIYRLPNKFDEKTDITIKAKAASGGGSVSAGFSGWYEA
jgi:hypothetical protein